MKKRVFLIPGFKLKPSSKIHTWLVQYLTRKGFDVDVVPIKWDYQTMSDYIRQFEEYYEKHKGKENYVMGYSYGAVITFCTAQKLQPKKIILFSLSPDFAEDVESMPRWIQKYIGIRRLNDAKTRSARAIARKLTVPTVVLYGEAEGKQYPQLKQRCEETTRLARNARLVRVKNAPHNIAFPEYREAIKKLF